jgi:hypothetical protein
MVAGARSVDRYLRALDGSISVHGVLFAALERDFVEDAKRFSELRGISYEAWRDVGVSDEVLRRARIVLEVVTG